MWFDRSTSHPGAWNHSYLCDSFCKDYEKGSCTTAQIQLNQIKRVCAETLLQPCILHIVVVGDNAACRGLKQVLRRWHITFATPVKYLWKAIHVWMTHGLCHWSTHLADQWVDHGGEPSTFSKEHLHALRSEDKWTASQEQKVPMRLPESWAQLSCCWLSLVRAVPAETRLQSHSFHLASALLHLTWSIYWTCPSRNTRPQIISTRQMRVEILRAALITFSLWNSDLITTSLIVHPLL